MLTKSHSRIYQIPFEEFKAQFINDSKQIVNKEKLQRRMVGLISHLGDKEKLMPTITQEHVVEVEMSDYQIPIYAQVRDKLKSNKKPNKLKKERQKKENKNPPKRGKELMNYTKKQKALIVYSHVLSVTTFFQKA